MSTAGTRRARYGIAAAMLLAAFLMPVAGLAGTNPIAAIETRDANRDGMLDRLVITLRSDPGPVMSRQVLVGGYTVSSVMRSGASLVVALVPSGRYDTGVKPDVAFSDGRQWWLFLSSNAAYTDAAPPVLVAAVARDFGRPNMFLDQAAGANPSDTMTLRFSEPVTLNVNATQDPAHGAPAQTPADRHVALEQVLQLNGVTMNGCTKDGDGLNGHNFPTPSPDTGRPAVNDPIDYGTWSGGPRVGATAGETIVVSMKPGAAPTTTGYVFAARPARTPAGAILARCTFSIVSAYAANVTDGAKNPVANAAPVTIVHAYGRLVSAPLAFDRDRDGIVDEIQLPFDHPLDAASVTAETLAPFTIAETGQPPAQIASARVASGSVLVLSLRQPAAWTSSTVPSVSYEPPAECTGPAVRMSTPVGDRQCLASFTLRSIKSR